jgi:bifunctional non-homologous end joining protein LigD
LRKPALSVYRHKRDFSKTSEPSGRVAAAHAGRLRFVVQKHAARRLHYDLRLELAGVFKSWALTRGPSVDPAEKRLAVEVEDHPLDYGDFEGTIPQGEYGGGTVQLWDRGFWSPEGDKPAEAALRSGDLKFTLDGERLHGSWVLVRMRTDRYGGKRINWLLIKHKDSSARPGDADSLLAEDRSVASGRTLQQIAAGIENSPKPETVKQMPAFIEPQLCKLVDAPPAQAGWAHEIKLDGYRAQLRVQAGDAVVRTRTGLDWTERFAAVAKAAERLPNCIMDGEVVALDQRGLPSFSALQSALAEERSETLIFYAFDLLFEGREDLRNLPLSERKSRLEKLLSGKRRSDRLRFVAHLTSSAADVFESARHMGLEGIVSKRLDAAYRSGRSGSWTKAKCRAAQEIVICGWTSEKGVVRSLLAGVYRGGHLVYVGRVGTGFGRRVAKDLSPRLELLTREVSPFGRGHGPPKEPTVRWLDPRLVAEIEFAGWTESGMIREAAFKGLREDKPARSVVAERAAPAPVPITPRGAVKLRSKTLPTPKRHASAGKNPSATRSTGSISVMGVSISKPDKAYWPDAGDGVPVSKLELAQYYEKVGSWMLPHLAGRPVSLVRVPEGFGGEQFFQRHAMAGMSNLLTAVRVKGDKAPYVQIDRIEALAAVTQIGTLEIHPWNCAPGDPEVAGRLVFDLDPAPDVPFDAVIGAALEIRERLTALGLEAFCKTTGGKGLHVVTPLTGGRGAIEWPVAKNFAHILCAQMAADSPTKYLDTMSKTKRVGKIFLDYLRNDKTATAIAVLSSRARAGATVSMPVQWKDVRKGLDPKRFTVRSAPALLQKSNPWREYDKSARSLSAAIRIITQAVKPKRRPAKTSVLR